MKTLPHSIEHENYILGCIFEAPQSIEVSTRLITTDDFYSEQHRLIYQAILDIHSEGIQLTIMNVVVKLRKENNIEKVGGIKYLYLLKSERTLETTIEYSCVFILELSKKRKLIDLCQNTLNESYEYDTNIFQILEDINSKSTDILKVNVAKEKTFESQNIKAIRTITERKPNSINGISSSLRSVNE